MVEEAAVAFGGAAGAGGAPGVGGRGGGLTGAFAFLGRGEVVEVVGESGGGEAVLWEGADADGAGEGGGSDGEDVPGADVAGWFGGLVLDLDVAVSAGLRGLGSRFEEAGGPEPLVDAEGVGHGRGLEGLGDGWFGGGRVGVGGRWRKPAGGSDQWAGFRGGEGGSIRA